MFTFFTNTTDKNTKMMEGMNTKLDQQTSAISELKNLLQEEIQLRKQDQLKIDQIENTILKMSTCLESQSKTASAVTGLHQKLDQFELDLRAREETMLAEMNKRLTEHQDKLCASIMANIEKSRNIKVSKRATESDDSAGPSKIAKPNVMLIKVEGNVQETSVPNSTSNSTSSARNGCYENWDEKSAKLKNTKFIDFQELRDILDRICEKGSLYDSIQNPTLTPEEMNDARKRITALKEVTISKYERFPCNGTYIDVNLSSKKNVELKKLLSEMDSRVFLEAAMKYKGLIQDTTWDLYVFENRYGLKWVVELETVIVD